MCDWGKWLIEAADPKQCNTKHIFVIVLMCPLDHNGNYAKVWWAVGRVMGL